MPFEEEMPHGQCQQCKRMLWGTHTDENPGREISIVDDEAGAMYGLTPEGVDETAGMEWERRNVSHTMCPDCHAAFLEQARQSRERRRQEREQGNGA